MFELLTMEPCFCKNEIAGGLFNSCIVMTCQRILFLHIHWWNLLLCWKVQLSCLFCENIVRFRVQTFCVYFIWFEHLLYVLCEEWGIKFQKAVIVIRVLTTRNTHLLSVWPLPNSLITVNPTLQFSETGDWGHVKSWIFFFPNLNRR